MAYDPMKTNSVYYHQQNPVREIGLVNQLSDSELGHHPVQHRGYMFPGTHFIMLVPLGAMSSARYGQEKFSLAHYLRLLLLLESHPIREMFFGDCGSYCIALWRFQNITN